MRNAAPLILTTILYFVAAHLVGAQSKLFISDRTSTPLLHPDKPWEDYTLNYCQVLREGARWHMYYGSYDHAYKSDSDGFICVAESTDGIHWAKPALNLYDYHGSRSNNILFQGAHGLSIFIDPAAPASERYKMTFSRLVPLSEFQVFGATSPEGLNWKMVDKPLLAENSDTQSVCFRDRDVYRMYVRMWTEGLYKGKRVIGYTESKTFGSFPAPRIILATDKDDPADLQFYTSAASKLRDNFYIMFPAGFYTNEGVIRAHVAISTDGTNFSRPQHLPILDVGPDNRFDSKGLYVAPGAISADAPNEFWFYYLGTATPHDQSHPTTQPQGGIGRFKLTITPSN